MTTSSDRQLIELAAKAARYQIEETIVGGQSQLFRHGELHPWNPLDNSGDTFDLALDCGITIEPMPGNVGVWAYKYGYQRASVRGSDLKIAGRRAVTIAAAELARGAQ